jgi:predicted anti-sigma-YlaC factor YlaD
MSCENLKPLMTAWIDGSCDSQLEVQLREHTQQCPSCAAFYREQQRLTRLLQSPELELEPPAWVWTRISAQLQTTPQPGSTGFWNELIALFHIPSLRYAALAVICFVVVSAGLLRVGVTDRSDDLMLAQLRTYQTETHGNPFEAIPAATSAANPFFTFESIGENPFGGNRSLG